MVDLLKFGLILAVTIFLLTRKWDLGLILLLDAGLAAILFAYPFFSLLRSIVQGIVAADTLNLAGAVFLVLVLAELMRRTHAMERMVASLQVVVPDSRVVLALMPTMIGLMPMLGGAMFSAPMVNEIGTRLDLTPSRKTYINYWFRHSMEYVFPLYSSLLMVSALLGVSVYAFVRASWPLSLAAMLGGAIWGLAGIHQERHTHNGQSKGAAWHDLLASTWPILLVILIVVVLQFNMLISLAVISTLFVIVKRIGPGQWRDILTRSLPVQTFSSIFGVMIFKQVLQDVGAVEQIPQALSTLGLPPLIVAFIVPMLVGLVTGTAPAAMALSLPLVAPLLTGLPIEALASGVWMFVGCFSGIMLSPMHLCLALTHNYFGASWGALYKALLPSVSVIIATAAGIVVLR
jgi:integral membrane protein (TIGR00529 family)